MEHADEMNKADFIAILASIREAAKTNGESKTEEHINKILEEIRMISEKGKDVRIMERI